MQSVSTCVRLCKNVLCSRSWGRKQQGRQQQKQQRVECRGGVCGGGGGGECDMDSVEGKK